MQNSATAGHGIAIGLIALMLTACGGSSSEPPTQQDPANTTDSDSTDNTNTDGDTNGSDTGNTDTGNTDAGNTDAGNTDNGNTDNSEADSSTSVGLQNCPALTGSGDIGELAGLWDVSEVEGDGSEDIFYIRISPNGEVTAYDYEQDSYGSGQNCYYIETSLVLSRVSGSRFTTTFYDDPDFSCQTDVDEINGVVESNGSLTISYVDDEDEDDDGNTTETLSFNYPLLNGVSVADLNACSD